MERIKDSCRALSNALPSGGLPIHQVRKFSAWARTTTGAPKFVVLENADKMQEGSRNALLKILEEPPPGNVVLSSDQQKGAMLPTVLSRLRAFSFSARTSEQEQKILTSLFQAEPGAWVGLGDYFQAFETQKKGLYDELAQTFLDGLQSPVTLWIPTEILVRGEQLHALSRALIQRMNGASQLRPLPVKERFFHLLQDVKSRRDTYNLGPALLVETLFYRCRAANSDRVSS